MSRHTHTGNDTRGEARCADRTRRPVMHGAVSRVAAPEMMALHETREAAALRDADDIHFLVRLEVADQHLIAGLHIAFAALETELAQELRALGVALLQVPRLRLVDPLRFHEFVETQLDGVIAVRRRGLPLHDEAGTGLE